MRLSGVDGSGGSARTCRSLSAAGITVNSRPWNSRSRCARKLQAHRDREFHGLELTVIPAALNERQVRADPPLPSTPLKRIGEPGRERMLPGADRVDEWLRAYGG